MTDKTTTLFFRLTILQTGRSSSEDWRGAQSALFGDTFSGTLDFKRLCPLDEQIVDEQGMEAACLSAWDVTQHPWAVRSMLPRPDQLALWFAATGKPLRYFDAFSRTFEELYLRLSYIDDVDLTWGECRWYQGLRVGNVDIDPLPPGDWDDPIRRVIRTEVLGY